MIELLSDRKDTDEAQGLLSDTLTRNARPGTRVELGFQGGNMPATVFWRPDLGIWMAFEREENRYWNAFGLDDPCDASGTLSIDVEINPPYEGINRRIAGGFARDEDGEVYLIHRGKVGGGRKGIGKEAFLRSYSGAIVPVRDGDRETAMILIAALTDPRAPAHLAAFVRSVDRFKRLAIGHDALPDAEPVQEGFSPEFVGEKVAAPREQITMRCDHGAVVNTLANLLEKAGLTVGNDQLRDLFIRDRRGRIAILLEVKSSGNRTAIYEAVGQLTLHSPVRRSVGKVAVLPVKTDAGLLEALRQRGIEVVRYEWKGQRLEFKDVDILTGQESQK